MREEALLLGARGSLVSVYTPASELAPGPRCAALLVNAGLVHHVGPNRLHVRIARTLAAVGVSCLRFDLSGIGDSPARADGLSVLQVFESEPREIMDALSKRGYERFVLIGICSGADCAQRVAGIDPRVAGVILINPHDLEEDPAWQAHAHSRFYLTRSITNPRAWLNLFTGRTKYRRLLSSLMTRSMSWIPGRARHITERAAAKRSQLSHVLGRAHVLFIISEQDVSTAYLHLMTGGDTSTMQRDGRLTVQRVDGSDHLFTRLRDQNELVRIIAGWCPRVLGYE